MDDNIWLWVEILGWLGNAAFLSGAIILARGNAIWAQILNIFGNALYIFFALLVRTPSLVALSIILIIINIIGIMQWRKQHAKKN